MFPIFAGNSASTGYNLTRSLRLRSSASAYLSRTPSVAATSNKIFTISFWAKPSLLVPLSYIWFLDCSGQDFGFYYNASYTAAIQQNAGANYITTSQVFRDPAAWYHFVLAVDTTQATAANRIKLYVNGSQVTAFSGAAYPPQNTTFLWNQNGQIQYIGRNSANASILYDGYFAEFYSIDGQQLTPSSFGSTNTLTGVWQPARYTGTYGTNGFYLPFTDNSALTTSSNVGLGKDFSGNGNYWTTNNISITAGVTYDSMTDVPTLTSATAANFAVLNPLNSYPSILTNGNLNVFSSGVYQYNSVASIMVNSGKWYAELTVVAIPSGSYTCLGLVDVNFNPFTANFTNYPGGTATSYSYFSDGNKYNNAVNAVYGSAFVAGDVIAIAYDASAGSLSFYRNNTSVGVAYSGLSGSFAIATMVRNSAQVDINFGQRPFSYSPPSGFVALNTYNLPTSTIVKGNTVMDATLYTGTNATLSVTNAGAFKPDLVWIKGRSQSSNNVLQDSVRGANRYLSSNSTAAEGTDGSLTSFNSNGFSLTTDPGVSYNANGTTYVGWQWQAGQGSSSSNTSGTITSTVSVNASAGFSVATFTRTAAATDTAGHGLGVKPAMVIIKARSTTSNWNVWHQALDANPDNFYILLDSTAGKASSGSWCVPTSSVVGVTNFSNGTTAVMYSWTPIAGFSAFGSYTGNGSTDGPFVYTGFRPKFVMVKCSSSDLSGGAHWAIEDSSRSTYNAADAILYANLANTEGSGEPVDFLSNGFKIRNTVARWNSSGATFIYMAFAESPFRNSLAR